MLLNGVNIGAQCRAGRGGYRGVGHEPAPQVIKFTHAQLLALFCPRAQLSCLCACL